MNAPLTYGSVCSGMEAASLAWAPLGWKCAFLSEIDKAPCALLEQRYPDVPNFGDMTKFEDWPDVAIDLLVGGTPCQSFSVAGLRKGLADPRGSLMLCYGAIARRYRPRWLVWENVPGVLSSNEGRDFGAFLGMLAELGYGFAYRVLDAQYFNLAQRRARVFVVGYLGDWRPPAAVLFEPESLRGDSPPSREAGQGIAPTIAARTRGGGGLGTDAECDGALIPEISYALNGHGGGSRRLDGESETFVVANTLLGKENSSHAADMDTYVAHSLRADGFDASEDGTGRGTPIIPILEVSKGTSSRGDGPNGCGIGADGDPMFTLQAGAQHAVAFDPTQITSKANRSNPQPGDPCHTLAKGQHAPALAFSCKDHGADAGELAPALRAMGHDGSHANAGGQAAVAFQTSGNCGAWETGAITGALDTNTDPNSHVLLEHWAVRRLTPTECERLQGAPDGWTNIAYRGRNTIADGPRYKMIGNSFAVHCVRWIGERVSLVNGLKAADDAEGNSDGK